MEYTIDGKHFECSVCYGIPVEGFGQFLVQSICKSCFCMNILCASCEATYKDCIMGGCNGELLTWKDIKLTTIARNITKRCPRSSCNIMTSLGDQKAHLNSCSMQRPYTDEEMDELLSPLKIPLVQRDRYNNVQAERDISKLFDKFLYDSSFIRRTLQYMDANPDGEIFTIVYRPHVLQYIERINREEDIDFVIEAV